MPEGFRTGYMDSTVCRFMAVPSPPKPWRGRTISRCTGSVSRGSMLQRIFKRLALEEAERVQQNTPENTILIVGRGADGRAESNGGERREFLAGHPTGNPREFPKQDSTVTIFPISLTKYSGILALICFNTLKKHAKMQSYGDWSYWAGWGKTQSGPLGRMNHESATTAYRTNH